MTPNHLEILLHCHCSAAPHPRRYAPAVIEALADMEREGLIVGRGDEPNVVYATTERGKAHVKQLCALPRPIAAWVGADGKVIG